MRILRSSFGVVIAAILLAQNISLLGFLNLGLSIAGLLWAAITNVLIWVLYIPMYAVKRSDFASSIVLAVGLTWLFGVAPFPALVSSPAIMLGKRLLPDTQLSRRPLGDVVAPIGKAIEQVDLAASVKNVANAASGLAARIKARRIAIPLPA